MNKETVKKLNGVKVKGKIRAEIKHCNGELNLENLIVNLINDEDSWHLLDIDLKRTPNKLAWNWNIIDFREIE